LEAGEVHGAVTVARTEHYSEKCVLEWQADFEVLPDFWQPVEMVRVPALPRSPTVLTREELCAWLAEATLELETCPNQFKASVRLRIEELNRLLTITPATSQSPVP